MASKILLDTDIGSDIDDAVCLAYLLAQPQCELMGITTVSGEPVRRAQMASAMCRLADREVPIFPGAATPFIIEQKQQYAPQAAALTRWEHDTGFPTGEAVEFMRRTIRQNPGEITLLAIGPLTNVALLFKTDPEIPKLLKSLVLMCGVFSDGYRPDHQPGQPRLEWNALLDPHATEIVYRAAHDMPQACHRSVGLDVTLQVVMDAPSVRKRFSQHKLLQPVLDFAEVWFERVQQIVFHDPLAATTLFDPNICAFEQGDVSINLSDPARMGQTDFVQAEAGSHDVAVSVNADRFFDHYFGVLS